jgi:uncharacterized protein (UPF0216 family)
MTGQTNFFNRTFIIFAVCLLSLTTSFAAEKNYSLVTENLSKKLQNDLANDNVTVKLNNVAEYKISKNEIELKGDATCTLNEKDTQLPIQFEVKVNPLNQSVINIKYDFVDTAADYNSANNEEFLMKELMKEISRDYKTENIVIAIDAVETIGNMNNEKKFLGAGEVRIGDMVWNKIKFNVVLNAQTQKASKIIYKLEK